MHDDDASPAALAAQLGTLDLGALFHGGLRPVAAFLAPVTPRFAAARTQWLSDGSGPLRQLVSDAVNAGQDPAQAEAQVRSMLPEAVGMLVLVCDSDHGVVAMPQLLLSRMPLDWIEHAASACVQHVESPETILPMVRGWLVDLDARQRHGAPWPTLIASAAPASSAREVWLDLASAIVDTADRTSGTVGTAARASHGALIDLSWWTSQALLSVPGRMDGDDVATVARCLLLAGDHAQAMELLALLSANDPEAAVDVVCAAANAAISAASADSCVNALTALVPTLEARVGVSYDLRLAVLRVCIAAGDARVPACAAALIAAQRKSARHDLSREPIWRVTTPRDELIDTASAAALIERSTHFISKRLDAATIPHHHDGTHLRIPRASLLDWKTVMDTHSLWE